VLEFQFVVFSAQDAVLGIKIVFSRHGALAGPE
jgi:hypothetical protein